MAQTLYTIQAVSKTLTSQTTENTANTLTLTTDSTFLTGTNPTYSGGRGSSALKVTGTWSATSGGFHNLYSVIDANGNLATANDGVVGIKSIVRSTDTAITAGVLYGGLFISKKAGSGVSTAQASHVGVEGWFMETGTGEVRTGLGGNFGYHCDSSVSHGSGGVWRGVQIFLDNIGDKATETTGLCIWNMAGAQDNAINVVNSASGFTNFVKFTDDGAPAASTCSTVSAIGTAGYITVKIGTATRYIGLSDTIS